jgi:hypothetical protein
MSSSNPKSDRASRMHANEISIEIALVQKLIAAQSPQWSGLQVIREVLAEH